MPRYRRICFATAVILAMMTLVPASQARDDKPNQVAEVTIHGNVLCNRATDSKPWFWDPKDGDHTPVIYALEGTPAIVEQVQKIMSTYPDRGLGVEDAIRVQDQFNVHLRYFISPGPIGDKIHKDVEAGSRLLALTGTLRENGGRRWLTVTRFEPSRVEYPAKMVAPDQPFVSTEKEPLLLKINDKLTLKCISLPPGRFLQGSPFYQRRYQDEYPHEVVLTKSFLMSETPVTQEIFEAVVGKNPSPIKNSRAPVEGVPCADILEFCRFLSRSNGVTVRLPTDAEWEYAARVGTSNPCIERKYGDQVSAIGSRTSSTPVQTKKPNAWGLYDMLCVDWHVTGDYKADNVRVRQVDPKGPGPTDKSIHRDGTGLLHKTRGGRHYDHLRPNMHGAATDKGTIWESGALIFRVVVEPKSSGTKH